MGKARIGSADDALTMSWMFDGDYVLDILVGASGFSGFASGHVLAAEFDSFRDAVAMLERTRRGEAIIESVYEGEFLVKVYSVDSLGHIGVSGKVRGLRLSRSDMPDNELTFGFEADPASLVEFSNGLTN